MKKSFMFLLPAVIYLLFTGKVYGQNFSSTATGIKARIEFMDIEIQFYSPAIVHIVKYPAGTSFTPNSYSVIEMPEKVDLKITNDLQSVTVSSELLNVKLHLATGKIIFFDTNEKCLLSEKDYGAQFTPVIYERENLYLVRQAFKLDKEEAIYGLGQQQNGKMSQRNQKVFLQQDNGKIAIPYVQSIKGYSLFWDNYSPTIFLDNLQEMSFDSQAGNYMSYYFMYGKSPDGVIAQMRKLTGQAPMHPLWTYGFWQSRERYKSQEEMLDVVKKFRSLDVPLDGIIQDWQYWSTDNDYWNSLEFGNPEFPDPQKMLDEVHKLNSHMIISVWPVFGPKTELYKEFKKKGQLIEFITFPQNGSSAYDAYNPNARKTYWEKINRNIFSLGMDGWWLDNTEPENFDLDIKKDQKTYAGVYRKVYNAYPLVTVGGIYDNQRAVTSDKRVFILTRSAFAGQQRYGANSWSGDVISSWDVLSKQIPASINFSICGIPYWNCDIGGFFPTDYPKGVHDTAFQELYTRWMQFAAFTPMMRSHGTGTPREIYLFGERGSWVFDVQEKYINLRYALLPYLYSTAWDVTSNSGTYMRGLFMDFPADKKTHDIHNQYLFGKSFLVAPVTEPMYVDNNQVDFDKKITRNIYLPQGTYWYDFWTGEKLQGGQTVKKNVSIDIMPVYVKAGTVLPIGPKVQYATQKKWDNLEIRIYKGSDGEFILYEDETDNYNYEKGIYSTIKMVWNDQSNTLTIENRKGGYPGMLIKRKFRVVIVDSENGLGDKKTLKVTLISYNGKQVKVKL